MSKIKNRIAQHLQNIPGWRTNRKIVVFESDDWGSIRMASREAYNRLLGKGYPVDYCAYNKNDALETNDDIAMLTEALDSVRDSNGKPAKFTINNVVANPDFEKIKTSHFKKYFYEPFTQTLQKYANSKYVMELYRQGIEQEVFRPQFHGREHLNINRWLHALQQNNTRFKDAFNENMFTVAGTSKTNGRRDYLDAFGEGHQVEFEMQESVIKEGMRLFKKIWNYNSTSFIAPCYTWDESLEESLYKNEIKFIQGTRVQRIPANDNKLGIKKKYHYQGQKNRYGQRYIIRNVIFEPVTSGGKKAVKDALKQIRLAFTYKKPAVICSHRLNYTGRLNEDNRNRNLRLLKHLLNKIIERYPEIEFMSTDQLGSLMDN